MCGIAGILNFIDSHQQIDPDLLKRMRDSMHHRGPDGAGLWVDEARGIGLAHRRLSIIDLSDAAQQPMCNEDKTLWLSFNGEIYNHAEIRQELQRISNHSWKTTHSDTEVILHAFEEWGIECLEKFRGMFALALWDCKNKELWLVRDRIGIKPLYYSIHNRRITFASEIKALLQDPEQKRQVHEEAFYHYLSFLTTPAPQTLFKGIKKLPGGTWLKVKVDGTLQQHRYWDVWTHSKPLIGYSEDEISEMLLTELQSAVNYRKVSDVPVGVFLSGGIDSSTNAALFAKDEDKRIKTFSIGYEGEYNSYSNELHFARRMADFVGAEYHDRLLTIDDLLTFLPQMVHLQDEPIADPVCVPVYYVSQLARNNGVTVCQVGEGADELFWGYPGWKTSLTIQRLDDLPFPRVGKKFLLACLNSMRSKGIKNRLYCKWLRRSLSSQPIFWGGAEAFTDSEKQSLLSNELKTKLAGLTSWDALQPIHTRFLDLAWEKSPLNWMSYLDLNLRLPELLLMRVDKMSMGVGLEARVPF